jgi:hypothetical protein
MKTDSPSACILALPFLLLSAGITYGQCKSSEILVGEDADNYYCMEKAKYEGSDAQNFGLQFCHAKLAVAADQRAIHELGFATDAERFELFADVAKEQRADLKRKVFDAFLDQGLEKTETMLKSAKSLNPWNVNNAVHMLDTKRFGRPTIAAALRRIALQKDKPAMFVAYRDFVDVAKSAKEGWDTGSDMAKDPESADLRLLVGALKVVQGNPELGLAVTTFEFSESVVYLWYVSGEASELAKLSDEKLKRIPDLTERLKGHLKTMAQSKKTWRTATGYATGTPVCGQ